MKIKLSRRQFLKSAAVAGTAMSLPLKFWVSDVHAFYQSPSNLKKFIAPLRGVETIPVAVPDELAKSFSSPYGDWSVDHYTIDYRGVLRPVTSELCPQVHETLGDIVRRPHSTPKSPHQSTSVASLWRKGERRSKSHSVTNYPPKPSFHRM